MKRRVFHKVKKISLPDSLWCPDRATQAQHHRRKCCLPCASWVRPRRNDSARGSLVWWLVPTCHLVLICSSAESEEFLNYSWDSLIWRANLTEYGVSYWPLSAISSMESVFLGNDPSVLCLRRISEHWPCTGLQHALDVRKQRTAGQEMATWPNEPGPISLSQTHLLALSVHLQISCLPIKMSSCLLNPFKVFV